MPTIKQTLALEKIVENHGNVSQAMKDAGYEENTAKNPKNLTDSKGYRQLLEECGLTEELITKALVEDIQSKTGKRVSEIALGAEILGMRKNGVAILNQFKTESKVEMNKESSLELAHVVEAYLRAKVSGYSEVTLKIPFS